MSKYQLLGISGSLRKASLNSILAREAARVFDPETFIEADLNLPLYSGDLQDIGIPTEVQLLDDQITQSDVVVISGPEYNKSLSGVLKNALDWASRGDAADDAAMAAYRGKVAALMSASPGALGGARGLMHLRQVLSNLGVLVLPTQQTIRQAGRAFDDSGSLVDQKRQAGVEQLGAELVRIIDRL